MTGNNMDNFTDDASPKAGVPTGIVRVASMNNRPKRMDFDVGKDRYGRSVTLTAHHNTNGQYTYSLEVHPYNQRDDGYRILDCLTEDNLLAMANATKGNK